MPQLKNKRHEIYAQAIADGKLASVAYQMASYRPNPSNASNLPKKFPEIQTRINELLEIKANELIAKREECCIILTSALRDTNKSDTIRRLAIESLAKLLNWTETKIVTENRASTMTDIELEKVLQEEIN